MIAGMVSHRGGARGRGLAHGRAFRGAVRANVLGFWEAARAAGWATGDLRMAARAGAAALTQERREEILGIARGAALPAEAVLAFDLFHSSFSPDECTVMMAVGSASATGSTVFMKNSDKIGADSLVGDDFYMHKEINIVVDLRDDSGRRIIGVSAAGSTGLKMGVNDAGVAAGSNIARTSELKERRVDVTQLRALDRGQILRGGLSYGEAEEAARWAVAAMIESPTDTPGNVEFADPKVAFIIEGSYRHWAVQEIRDRVAARSNMFVILERLNDPADHSSQARYARSVSLLEPLEGRVRPEDLSAFSQDHANGPGLNSICRHSKDHTDETSLSAMVATLDGADPDRSHVDFALGKPCWAWNDPDGVLSITLADPPEAIPERFRSGEVWRRLYVEEVDESGMLRPIGG